MKESLTCPRIWQLAAILALAAGCDQSDPNRPKTYPVSGTVTYNGQSLADANLNFQHAAGSASAFAKTDETGRYELMTFEQGDGAVPGDYKVAITKYPAPPTIAVASVGDYVPPDNRARSPAKNMLPRKYSNPKSSGLTATVTEGSNTVDFKLAD